MSGRTAKTVGGVAAAAAAAVALLAPAGATAKTTAQRVLFQEPAGTAESEIFARGGLQLSAACEAGTDLTVTVATAVDGATLHANRQGPSETDVNYGEIDQFDIADTSDLFELTGGPDNGVGGQLVYGRPEGRYVTIDWIALEDSLSAPGQCLFAGIAQIANIKPDRGSRRRIDYRADANAPAKRVLDAGLRLTASCGGGTPQVRARSDVPNSTIHVNSQSGPAGSHFEEDDLDPGESVALPSGLGGVIDSAAGQIVFATPTGRTASVDWMVEQEDAFDFQCVFAGTARVAGKDSPARVFFRRAEGDDDPGDPFVFREFFDRRFFSLSGSCATDASQAIDVESNQASSSGQASQSTSADGFRGSSSNAAGAVAVPLTDDASGHSVTAAANGAVATVDWLAEDGGDAFGGGPDCLFAGTADVLKP